MDYGILFNLESTDPIITIGREIQFIEYELQNNEVINEQQRAQTIESERATATDEKEKEPVKKTKAELKRERRQRRLEINRRRLDDLELVRQRRDEENLHRYPVVVPEVHNDNIPQGIVAAAVQFVGRMFEQADPDIDDPDNEIAELDMATLREKFWDIIGQFNWHNVSDGIIQRNVVTNVIERLSATDRRIFRDEYHKLIASTNQILELDGIFDRTNAISREVRATIMSHIIALGDDQYITLINDIEILQFLIEVGECQSLNALLPDDIRI